MFISKYNTAISTQPTSFGWGGFDSNLNPLSKPRTVTNPVVKVVKDKTDYWKLAENIIYPRVFRKSLNTPGFVVLDCGANWTPQDFRIFLVQIANAVASKARLDTSRGLVPPIFTRLAQDINRNDITTYNPFHTDAGKVLILGYHPTDFSSQKYVFDREQLLRDDQTENPNLKKWLAQQGLEHASWVPNHVSKTGFKHKHYIAPIPSPAKNHFQVAIFNDAQILHGVDFSQTKSSEHHHPRVISRIILDDGNRTRLSRTDSPAESAMEYAVTGETYRTSA